MEVNEKWVEVETIGLNTQDRNTILSVTGWLDDKIINAAQTLLKMHFSTPGLQYTTLGSNLSFDIIKADFVQMLHNGANHCVTVSNLMPNHHISTFMTACFVQSLTIHLLQIRYVQ